MLTEALAKQCFLNEYIYSFSQHEKHLLEKLMKKISSGCLSINDSLAIVGCYVPLYKTTFDADHLLSYEKLHESSKELISIQYKEPLAEIRYKRLFEDIENIQDKTSRLVGNMYEENPYPRFRYSDHEKELAYPIIDSIRNETTIQELCNADYLMQKNTNFKVLIAGCGTGNQIINASRYKNAEITAIDLSSSSLAYANRKVEEYEMDNVILKKMDLLDSAQLNEVFDVIECSGVLHHMNNPLSGLQSLVKQLKVGGYIKLGLYSHIARADVVKARNLIESLGIQKTSQGIRSFRQKVLQEEYNELVELTQRNDFYSLSTFRDLCFHVQEYRFTLPALEAILRSQNLSFCGFMLPSETLNSYKSQFPDDKDMISFDNWKNFEATNPTTFKSMYQFWAYKLPSH